MKGRTYRLILISTFFGLRAESRILLFRQIHEICFHGKGGYSWNDVWNMPIWLRTYIFNELKKHYQEENKDPNILEDKTTMDLSKIKVPDFVSNAPTYVIKKPKG